MKTTTNTSTGLAWPLYVGVLVALTILSVLAIDMGDVPGVWVDEEITLMLVDRWTLWELVTVLPVYQPHFPTYYLGVELLGAKVMRLAAWLSLPATVWGTVELAREYVDDWNALLAGLLVAVSPFLAVQAGWLRMYGLLSLLGVWLVVWAVRGRWRRAWAAAAAMAVLHMWGVFPVVWLAAYHYQKTRLRRPLVYGGVLLMPASVLFVVSVGGPTISKASTGVGHAVVPSARMILLTPIATLVGSPHTSLQVVLGVLGTFLLFWQWRDIELLAWVVLPIVGISVLSLLHPVFRLKYFGFIGPVVAVGLVGVREEWVDRLLWLAVVGVLVVSWLLRRQEVLMARRFVFWS